MKFRILVRLGWCASCLLGCADGGEGDRTPAVVGINPGSPELFAGAVEPPSLPGPAAVTAYTDPYSGSPRKAAVLERRVWVGVNDGTDEAAAKAVVAAGGGRVISQIPALGQYLVEIPDGDPSAFLAVMRAEPRVKDAQPDAAVAPALVPNEAGGANQSQYWYLDAPGAGGYGIDAFGAFDAITDGLKTQLRSQTLGIVDVGFTGAAASSDFIGRLVVENDDGALQESHGTLVLQMASALGDNEQGAGLDWFSDAQDPAGTSLVPQSFSPDNNGQGVGLNWFSHIRGSRVARGGAISGAVAYSLYDVYYRAALLLLEGSEGRKAEVLNLSFGAFYDPSLMNAADYADQWTLTAKAIDEIARVTRAPGIKAIVVLAAGNDDVEIPLARRPEWSRIVFVGGTDPSGDRWDTQPGGDFARGAGSNFGALVDLSAPASDIGYYDYSSSRTRGDGAGTSLAAPLVAAACQLMWAKNPGMSPEGVLQQIKDTATRPPSWDSAALGAGILNLGLALDASFPPGDLTASAVSPARIELSWQDASTDELGFEIERSADGTTFTQIVSVGPDVTTFSDTRLTEETTYYYRVRAFNATGSSVYSGTASATTAAAASAPPDAPSDLVAVAVSSFQANLGWTDNSPNEYGFQIERAADGVNFVPIAVIGLNLTTYRDVGLSPATAYAYRVRAFNSLGESAYTATAAATTPVPPPGTDVTPPVAGRVNDGATAPDIDSQASLTTLSANWAGFDDSESGIVNFAMGIGTAPGTSNVVPFTSVGVNTRVTVSSLALSVGTTYYTTVVATNGVGLQAVVASDGLIVSDDVALAVGAYHTIVLKVDGTVWAWGRNEDGQLGDGTAIDRSAPVPVRGQAGIGFLGGITMLGGGISHTIALKFDGTVLAWGSDFYGQLGNGTRLLTDELVPIPVVGPGGTGLLTGVAKVACGHHHAAALKEDGTVWVWGQGPRGDGVPGTPDGAGTPVQVLGPGGAGVLTGIVMIAAGGAHTVALKDDGTIWAWGRNVNGQLGDGSTLDRTTPLQVKGPGGTGALTGITRVAAGAEHTLALENDGTVWAWGLNATGQLGDGTNLNRSTPVSVKGPDGSGSFAGATLLAAGVMHSIAVRNDGTVWAWGYNADGELADGTATSRSLPVQALAADGITFFTGGMIAGGGDRHTAVLKSDGTVWGWGMNLQGQLGDGSFLDSLLPIQARGPDGLPFLTQ